MSTTDPDKPLYLNGEGSDKHGTWSEMAPLLTCGHYGQAHDDRSSVWDFPHEAWICPECGEERQMDMRLQLLLDADDGWSYLT